MDRKRWKNGKRSNGGKEEIDSRREIEWKENEDKMIAIASIAWKESGQNFPGAVEPRKKKNERHKVEIKWKGRRGWDMKSFDRMKFEKWENPDKMRKC